MYHKPQATDSDIYDGMSPTISLNTDIIWLVLQHAAYTDDVWDRRTLRECCLVSREWYPLAKRILFRFVILRNRRQLRALQQTRGKHLQIGSSAPPNGPVDTWEAQTCILACYWCNEFRFNDIRHALTLFPSLYEVRVTVHIHEYLRPDGNDSLLAIPSTIRALRYSSVLLSETQNIACASHIISVLSKHSRLHCLQFKGASIIQLPSLFQSVQVNALLYLELQISNLSETLSGDLFPNLLYLVLHQKLPHSHCATPIHGVFKRVKSLTALYYSRMVAPEPILQLSRFSETFPELTKLRLGIRLFRLHLSTITPLLSQIPSGLVSLSLFITTNTYTPTEENWPRDSFTIPKSLKYFEYGLRYYSSISNIVDPPVLRPFLDSCRSMEVQLLPSPIHEITEIVSILPTGS